MNLREFAQKGRNMERVRRGDLPNWNRMVREYKEKKGEGESDKGKARECILTLKKEVGERYDGY